VKNNKNSFKMKNLNNKLTNKLKNIKMKQILIIAIACFLTSTAFGQVRVDGPSGFTTIGSSDVATATLDLRNGDNEYNTRLIVEKRNNGMSTLFHYGTHQFNLGTKESAHLRFITDATYRLTIGQSGLVRVENGSDFLIRTGDLTVEAGEAYKTGSATFTILSDARLKNNVQNFDMGLNAIMQINPVTYNYNNKSNADTEKNHVGILAQDVEKVAPFMVNEGELTDFNEKDELVSLGTYKNVNTDAFTYMLINAVQELKGELDAVKEELAALKVGNTNTELYLNGTEKAAILKQNVPNPFSSSTTIEYFVPNKTSNAKVVFTDINGNTIKIIEVASGRGTIDVNVNDLMTGVYTYALIVDGIAQDSKRMIVE